MLTYHYPDKATVPFILDALGIGQKALRAQGIEPLSLVEIYDDFTRRRAELAGIAEFTANSMMRASGVYMVKHRVKDSIHLLRKLIRKKQEYPNRTIDQNNYLQWINDLIGVRVLYLYKDSWINIGKYIQEVWQLKRRPIAYISDNETEQTIEYFLQHGCDIKTHEHGYRAIHFVIATQPGKQEYFVEVQLRTLFEEGWSEIDHTIRYPDHICSKFVRDLLSILNRLSGNADEMASFINELTNAFESYVPLQAHKAEFTRFKLRIEELPIMEEEKQVLRTHINHILEKGENS